MRWIALALALGLAALWAVSLRGPRSADAGGAIAIGDVLAGDAAAAGFARADRMRAFAFPRDHGAHAEFRSEWWYFTGNLSDPAGRPFGFQLTLFRFALDPRDRPSASAWRTRQIVLGHFAVADIAAGRYYADERMSRAAFDLAGATTEPAAAWIDRWRIELADPLGGTWRLRADSADTRLELELRPTRPVTLQGERGLSRKNAEPGNASYYYSITRLAARGSIATPAGRFEVDGTAWLDREWSTSALARDQIGWDWFALQLDDGSDLMFYRLRRADGALDPYSSGVFVAPGREALALTARDVEITNTDYWPSPATGIRYPSAWRLVVPGQGLELTIEPRLEDQEWTHMIHYWEGAVAVAGQRRGRPLSGLGYVELTGYDRR